MRAAVHNMHIILGRSDECTIGGPNRLKHKWTNCTENIEDASSSATGMYHCIIAIVFRFPLLIVHPCGTMAH